jgi:hypothetical protein
MLSVFTENRKTAMFFAAWLVLTLGPMSFITINYMIEPRYLTSSLLPLSGLGAIGLQWIKSKKNWHVNEKTVFVGICLIMLANISIIKLMPYELDKTSILKAVKEIKEQDKNASILVPWAYSDFNFLRITVKDINIYNVNAPGGNLDSVNNDWKKRIKGWYGEAYIDNELELHRLIASGPCYYLGWRKYPPLETLEKLAGKVGFKRLKSFIDSMHFKNHLAESWIWRSPNYMLKLMGTIGQYEYYKVLFRNLNSKGKICLQN